jgi:cytochrome b561
VAITIHWTSAIAVILAFAAGYVVDNVAPPEQQPGLLIIHIALGSMVFVLTLLRIVWWMVADRHPPLPADHPRWQARAAQVVHVLLYVVILLMASSGIATVVMSGALPTILSAGPVPDFSQLVPRIAHGAMSGLVFLLMVVHVLAALYHQFIRRDRLLARMGIGRA